VRATLERRRPPLFPTSSLLDPPPPPPHVLAPYHHDPDWQQQQQPGSGPRRRSRTNFSGFQLDALERVFSRRHYPDTSEVAELSYQLAISESRVQVSGRDRL